MACVGCPSHIEYINVTYFLGEGGYVAALCAHMYHVPVLRGVVFAVLRRLTRGPIAPGVTGEVVVCAKSAYMMTGLIGHPSSHLSVMAAAYCCRPLLADYVGWLGESSATMQLLAILGCSTYV